MPTLNQLIRKGRKKKKKKIKKTALKFTWNSNKKTKNNPFAKGTVKKIGVLKPKKPNSANRSYAKVVLVRNRKGVSKKKEISVYIPGEKHNLQEYSQVLIAGGGARDLPGVKYHVVRGYADSKGVEGRKQGRSLYGTKKNKA